MLTSPIVQLTTDQIGDLGELLAALALSRPVLGRYKRPLFMPTHLGGKYPAADFVVDVLGSDNRCGGFFFIQVKSTRKAGSSRRRRLPVTADRVKLNDLTRLPAPAYLIGVDLATEQSYIVSAFTPWRTGISSITMRYPLSIEATRMQLYREVTAYWSARKRSVRETEFHDD